MVWTKEQKTEYNRKYQRTYRKNNPKKIQEHKKKYRDANHKKILEGKKIYREHNSKILAEKQKDYYKNNREWLLHRMKFYNQFKDHPNYKQMLAKERLAWKLDQEKFLRKNPITHKE